jgi:hypothetical protein
VGPGVSRVFNWPVYCCGATAPIPSHKAHGRLRGLSKQRIQRAFMPQCGRLRAISVCGLEPTDPPPQKIADEMKGPPANPAPAAATHHTALEVAWTVVPVMILIPIRKTKVAPSNAIPG